MENSGPVGWEGSASKVVARTKYRVWSLDWVRIVVFVTLKSCFESISEFFDFECGKSGKNIRPAGQTEINSQSKRVGHGRFVKNDQAG